MPRGDTTLRKSFFHAILTNSIPVVFEDDYFRYAPFADVSAHHQIYGAWHVLVFVAKQLLSMQSNCCL